MDNKSENKMDEMKQRLDDKARIARSEAELAGVRAKAKTNEFKNDIKDDSRHLGNVAKEKMTQASNTIKEESMKAKHTAEERMQEAKNRIQEKFD